MINEIKRRIIDEGYFTETYHPFTKKPIYSSLSSIIDSSSQGPLNGFLPIDSIRNNLEFSTLYEEYNLSPNHVDILLFDNNFLETDIAHGMIFKGKRFGIFLNLTRNVDTGYKYIEKIRGEVQSYMMESKDIVSTIYFELKNKNNQLKSFFGQCITFRFSIKEIYFHT